MKKWLWGALAGLFVGTAVGFALGVYTLPILVEFLGDRRQSETVQVFSESDPTGEFDRDSPGSDPLHWGEGRIRLSSGHLIFEDDVRLAPGPDYRIYMTTKFVDNRDDFKRIKAQAVEISKLKNFSGPQSFELPPDLDTDVYDNVVVWCEAFAMYIASARID
ncbi:MAG: DM13 domain-containing protein [Acidiferrobacterales bacterium]|nr:DM13 domain-containing protein [Acidiferrobacterales bacterium]